MVPAHPRVPLRGKPHAPPRAYSFRSFKALKESESFWAKDGTYGAVLALAEPVAEEMPEDEQIAEFVELVQLAIRYGDR